MTRSRITVLLALGALALATTGAVQRGNSAAPIRIGIISDCAGIWSTFYDYTLAGAELALIERGARPAGQSPVDGVDGATIAGRPVRLSFGCADNTPASALTEARRLVENVGVDVVIGPLSGNEELALQEYSRRRPGLAFVNGSSSVPLQDPAPNFFSFHTDGAQWEAGVGAYAYHRLGWRTAVTLTRENDVFFWSQSAAFIAEFCSLGGHIVKRVSVPPGTTDFSGITAQLPRRGVDGVFFGTNSDAVVALARAYPGLRGNLARRMLTGISGLAAVGVLGSRISGVLLPDRNGPGYYLARKPYQKALHRAFPRLDPHLFFVFDADYYAAMKATIKALEVTHGDLAHGERSFQAALARVELDLPNGRVRLDARHQAIAPNYLWRITKPDFTHQRLIRTISNVERTFGGYFTARDKPPGPGTPLCRVRTPPLWAR
jgi:branched-chain amino acid transport system substrate-binding protein